ncbi:hypothetical protein K445DRAFT_7020 [Daldinia sp. EC12]|nr:hypothetical protein F4774DRAFT_14290 [Daldinia eschscholtzii]OTB20225.1 hypothetical protein K445DRAFT_7020 [Daldinia sp. EC12]
MAPKKKEQQQKMSLGAFLNEEKYGGSWADEVEDSFGSQPLPSTERRTGYSSYGGSGNDRGYSRDSYATQAPAQLPTKPPFTAHLGNLSYEATNESVTDFFEGCDITSVRIIEDRIEQRPKGFAYAEFANVEGLKKALTLDGTSFQGRTIKIKIADPPKERDNRGESARDLSSWERKGPLADLPSRSNDRRPAEFGERRAPTFRDAPPDDGKVRDFGNWERKGPLSPLPQPERPEGSRDSSRPRTHDANRDSFRKDRRASPATWGEGRQEGSRPPREFKDRPERPERPERTPTAAERDNQWRSSMRPDPPVKSPERSRDGSEAPSSPAAGSVAGSVAAPAPAGRPRLNLQKRTVSESPDVASPGLPSASGDSKASPFGAARPIDTAAKEREIAEKREQQLKEKREAEEKAKEERRLAKEAAAKEAAEKEAAAAEKAKAEPVEEKTEVAAEAKEEPKDGGAQNGGATEHKVPVRSREGAPNTKSRATESGNWRTSSGEQRQGRGGYVNAPRGRGDARGRGGAPRGPRGNFEGRGGRANGHSEPRSPQQPTQPSSPAPEAEAAPVADPDGWTTVPAKGRARRT